VGQIDPERERQRLAKLYSGMNDGELERVGDDPGALTEWARESLRSEMARRGRHWQETPPKPKIELPEKGDILVLLRVYGDTSKAVRDKNLLEGAGIAAHFFDEKTAQLAGLTPGISPDGVRLLVRSCDFLKAEELLMQEDAGDSSWAALSGANDEGGKPVVLRQYRDITAAMVDRTALESAGIECYLYDANLVRLDWFISNAIGGVKLVVGEKYAEEAEQILSHILPGEPTDNPRS
jgi:hypothetical protein